MSTATTTANPAIDRLRLGSGNTDVLVLLAEYDHLRAENEELREVGLQMASELGTYAAENERLKTANPALEALVIVDRNRKRESRESGFWPKCDGCDEDARHSICPPPSSTYGGWAAACDRHLEGARYQMALRVLERMGS